MDPLALNAMEMSSAEQEPDITYLAEIVTLSDSKYNNNNNNNNNVSPEYKVLASLNISNKNITQKYYQDDEELSEISLKMEKPNFTQKTIKKMEIVAQITVTDPCETDRVFEESFENIVFDVPLLKPFTDDQDDDKLFMRFIAITKSKNKK